MACLVDDRDEPEIVVPPIRDAGDVQCLTIFQHTEGPPRATTVDRRQIATTTFG